MADLQSIQDSAAESAPNPGAFYDAYEEHTSGHRIHTASAIHIALRKAYPNHCITACSCDLVKYANSGHAVADLAEDEPPNIRSRVFEAARRRTFDDDPGQLRDAVLFGRYDYRWEGHKFLVYVVQGETFARCDNRTYILSEPERGQAANRSVSQSADALILAACAWAERSHEEVWVYDQGRWNKDKELWKAVQDKNFDDIVLEGTLKSSIMRDMVGFFDGRKLYAEYGAPWKRGLIFHGPPGNGKTMTVKAIMNTLMSRSNPIPTLYIKTLSQRGFGPQMSVRQIFSKARSTAPCLLLFEDLDSLITDEVRSYFLNELDGLEDNDGILMIGSTNHLEKLDPGLSKRPSRFDRKYRFSHPSFEQRKLYCEQWSNKLSSNPAVATPSTVPEHIASVTDGFSYAYLKEAYLGALLTLLRESVDDSTAHVEEEDDQKWGRLGNMLQKQVAILRAEMAEAEEIKTDGEK
ncbi:MAG: hypothetical protein M1819_001049 [Sarea resinae]|nr:MAG: hypothetical protein M1819_001049 [Sarea resinae]